MNLAQSIDHTLLRPDTSMDQIRQLCQEAKTYQFKAVCVSPVYAELALTELEGSGVRVASVVGFSSGTHLKETKIEEARALAKLGVHELDMVLANHAFKNGREQYALEEMIAVKEAALQINPATLLKVIIETSLLERDQIIRASQLVVEAGAHFVKTSTGFHGGGASVEDIRLIKETIGERALIKASGGIRTTQDALAMLRAGASRLGTSGGVAIMQGHQHNGSY